MSTRIQEGIRVEGRRVAQRDAQWNIIWSNHPAGISAANWDPDAYEAAVVATFPRLQGNPVGRIVLSELVRPVTIIPFRNQAGGNAVGIPTNLRGATAHDEPQHYCGGPQIGQLVPGAPLGTGVGSSGFVEFTPQHWRGVMNPGPSPLVLWADELLLHELVHVLAHTHGTRRCVAAGFGYDTYEEFVAIAVVNVYRSHYHRPQRDNHHGFQLRPNPVPPNREDAEDRMLRILCALMPGFVDRLSQLDESIARENLFRVAAARNVLPRVGLGGPPRQYRRRGLIPPFP